MTAAYIHNHHAYCHGKLHHHICFIGQHYYTYMYILAIIFQWGEHQTLIITSIPSIKDTLSGEALTLSITNMHDVF